jgi:hypothetical protein
MIKSAAQSSLLNDTKHTSMSAGIVPSSEYLIESAILNANTPSVTFNNLSQYAGVYKHLQVIMIARSQRDGGGDPLMISINGSSFTIGHNIFSTTSSVSYNAPTNYAVIDCIAGGTSTANNFGGAIIDFLDAYSTNKTKTITTFSGISPTIVSLSSTLHLTTSAIESITFTPFSSTNFVSGSRFSLYGVTI